MAKTVKDVAAMAGVTPSTVSRVFRASPHVSPGTRERVLEASRRCGYFPHSAARAMRAGRFQRIACVLTRYGPIGAAHCNFNGYLDMAADLLGEQGYSVIFEPFHLTPVTREVIEAPRLFSELAVDGILAFDAVGVVPEYVDERIADLHAPVVWINRTPTVGLPCVNSDETANARLMVRYLLDLGHRRIGYLGVDEPHYSMTERFETVVDELRRAGCDASALRQGRSDDSVTELARRVLDRQPPFTAVICYNFRMFHIALQMAASCGLRVPGDVSLCYFISPPEIPHFDDCLGTGVVVPERPMVEKGIDLLMAAMEGRPVSDETARIAGELFVGRTTSAPANEGRE
ncbi:MAG: LacI family transcriptional regulator [Phycisphaerae bacterium]|nr:LacI family transcriptional regulator [Phycisphaerae bacterium]